MGPMELDLALKKVSAASGKTVLVNQPGFRPDTELPVVKNCFVFGGAGMGDFICYMPAMLWIARNCPWIEGWIFCPQFMVEFCDTVMQQAGFKWKVRPAEKINELNPGMCVFTGPGLTMNGQSNKQLFNGTGGHLVDVGYAMMVNRLPLTDAERTYPQIVFSDKFDRLMKRKFDLPDKYVVLTPGAVSENRMVPGHYWNPIVDYVVSKGMTPVFLGKTQMSEKNIVKFPDGCDYDKGMDLRDDTSMLEAAWVMKHAVASLGFDNGLIHLAACTDASIIAGYGSVHPRERRAYRPAGKWIELFDESLPCAGCQTNMKKMYPHNFKYCLYKKTGADDRTYPDLQCIDRLFANDAKLWLEALESL